MPCRTLYLPVMLLVLLLGCNQIDDRTKSYPNRPIKIIVPFKPGGETDTFARIMKKSIEDNDLSPVKLVIINRDGAGATVGSRSVKNARPDGYTALCLHNALFTAKYYGTVPYGPEAFEPVAGTGEFGMVVAVEKSSTIKSLPDMFARIKNEPKSLTFGVNRGTPSHFAALMLENAEPGAQFRFAQSGSGVNRYGEVAGGHVDLSAFSIGEYVRFDKLRALAVFNPTRVVASERLREIPTALEQGCDVTTSNMQFWWFPKGTPPDRVAWFADLLERGLQTQYAKDQLKKLHCDPVFLKGKALDTRIDEYTKKLDKVSLRPALPLPNTSMILLFAVIGLGGASVVQAWRRSPSIAAEQGASPMERPEWITAVLGLVVTATYVALLQNAVDYRIVTTAFVFLLGTLFVWRQPRRMIVFLIIAPLLGFGLYYLFTRVFVVDLI